MKVIRYMYFFSFMSVVNGSYCNQKCVIIYFIMCEIVLVQLKGLLINIHVYYNYVYIFVSRLYYSCLIFYCFVNVSTLFVWFEVTIQFFLKQHHMCTRLRKVLMLKGEIFTEMNDVFIIMIVYCKKQRKNSSQIPRLKFCTSNERIV